MTAITVVDESTAGGKRSWTLDLLEEIITLRALIRRRIYQEVTEYNAKQMGVFQGLVQPTAAEHALNGARPHTLQRIDWEALEERAVEAFGRRAYLVLMDDRQVTDLDAQVELHAGSEVTFLKLVPLVGG
jgi:hypothetical protein